MPRRTVAGSYDYSTNANAAAPAEQAAPGGSEHGNHDQTQTRHQPRGATHYNDTRTVPIPATVAGKRSSDEKAKAASPTVG